MVTLLELAVTIIVARVHAFPTQTREDIITDLGEVYKKLKSLEYGGNETEKAPEEKTISPAMVRKSIGEDSITCLICGKVGMKSLARHLSAAHGMKPGEYKKQFGIPSKQPLAARSFSAAKSKMAKDRGLADILVKARGVRAEKLSKRKAKKKA